MRRVMEKSDEETNPLLPVTTAAPGIVAKEPELVTILEGKLLTHDEIGQEQEQGEPAHLVFEEEPGESTPLLLRSYETGTDFERSYESSFVSQSQKSASFSTSQASLFIPSIQFSLYSSRGYDFGSKSGAAMSRSAVISLPDASHDSSSAARSKSITVSLFEKISEDGQAPSALALWNMINMILGSTTVLSMPYAIALGGIAGVLALLLVGIVCDRTAMYLVECLYEVSPKSRLRKRVRANYAEIAADAWGPFGGRLVDFGIVTVSFCTCILMVMALGTSMMHLLKTVLPMTLQLSCLACAVFLLPTVFINRLTVLAWLSMLAVIALITSVIVLLGFSLEEFSYWTLDNLPSFDINTFPISLGMIVYGTCGHGVFTGIEGSMRERQKYNQVTHSAFTVGTIVKLLVGLCFCLLYGTETQSIITVNLGMSHKPILSGLISILVIINIFFSYPLNMFVVSGTLDALLLPKFPACSKGRKYHLVWTGVTRVSLVFLSLGAALAVPHFGLLMSVFGSLLGACISVVFPCLLHLQLKWEELTWFNIVVESFIIVFGVVSGCLGLVYSSMALSKS